jgi:glyoxylase-like metal-dependent hydrolase (beta-lactamase superfamily II)
MSLRSIRVLAVGLGLASLAAVPALAQDRDFSKVEVVSAKVAEGLYMLTGAGGNIGLSVGDDGAFLIDDQFAPLTDKIRAAVAAVSTRPVRFLVNTHWHGDHTGGNENFGKAGAVIVAHDNVRRRMSSEQFLAAFNEKVPASPKDALPIVTFAEAVTFHVNGDELRAFHVPPAHTDGDTVVHFVKADVVHAGDLFFNGMYPFIDLSSGGSLSGMVAAAERLLATGGERTRYIPGHGPLADRAALVAYRDMLAGVRAALQPLVKAGQTLEQAKAKDPLAPWNAKWGGGFMKPERFLEIAYASVQSETKAAH